MVTTFNPDPNVVYWIDGNSSITLKFVSRIVVFGLMSIGGGAGAGFVYMAFEGVGGFFHSNTNITATLSTNSLTLRNSHATIGCRILVLRGVE